MANDTLPEEVVELFRKFGKQGGDTTKKRHGKKHFSEAGTIGMAKRWGKKRKPAHQFRTTMKT